MLASCGFLLAVFGNTAKQASHYLTIGFWTICVHTGYKLMWMAFAKSDWYEPPVPFGLVYPVMLYLLARRYYRKDTTISTPKMIGLFAPFFIYLVFFAVALLQSSFSPLQLVYSKMYYWATLFSMLVYAIATVVLYNKFKGPSTPLDILIRQLTMLCFGLVALCYLVLYDVGADESQVGFDARPMVFLFLVTGFALILRYQVIHKFDIKIDMTADAGTHFLSDKNNEQAATAKLSDDLERTLVDTINAKMQESKLFLNPSVSLTMLAQHTGIPRHQLTQVFNRHYKKSFYQFIAAARIEYAMERLLEVNDAVTLDSLSYECGFNSKTSFNRYFKEYTGMTPSAFRTTYCQQLSIQ